MDFTAIARQAIYSTLSPDAVLSPSSSLHGPASLSPLRYPGGVLSPSDGTSYAELVAAARAAVASLPTRTLPPRLSPINAGAVASTLTELDLSLQRLESLRGAAASLEAQRRVSPTGARLDAAMLQGIRGSPQRLAASDLRASASASAGAGAGSAAALSELRSSLTATAERLQAATASLGAASASAASAAASPAAAHSRRPTSALTPAWTQATPQAAAAATPPTTSSAAASPMGGAEAAAAAARDRFSPIATPSRKRPLPVSPIASAAAAPLPPPPPPPSPPPHLPSYPSRLEDAHAAQRSAEALYLVSSSWRAAHHTPEALAHPAQGKRLVTYALEEGEEEGQGRLGGSGRGAAFSASSALPPSPQQSELFLASLCHAAGLEWHQQDQLLSRVKALSRASVACAGLNAFAGRVCHQLGTRLVGLGEAWEASDGAAASSVHYRPLRAMAQAAVPPAQPWGPAYTGLSQAEALLDAALNELTALRILRAHHAAGGRA